MKDVIVNELLLPRSYQLLGSDGHGPVDIFLHIVSQVVIGNVGHELVLTVEAGEAHDIVGVSIAALEEIAQIEFGGTLLKGISQQAPTGIVIQVAIGIEVFKIQLLYELTIVGIRNGTAEFEVFLHIPQQFAAQSVAFANIVVELGILHILAYLDIARESLLLRVVGPFGLPYHVLYQIGDSHLQRVDGNGIEFLLMGIQVVGHLREGFLLLHVFL